MTVFGGIVTYIIIWWTVLFTVLPWGVRSQFEDGHHARGTDPGAPVRTYMKRKLIYTSLIAVFIWGLIFFFLETGILTLASFPGHVPQ